MEYSCSNGHDARSDDRFCAVCGAPVAPSPSSNGASQESQGSQRSADRGSSPSSSPWRSVGRVPAVIAVLAVGAIVGSVWWLGRDGTQSGSPTLPDATGGTSLAATEATSLGTAGTFPAEMRDTFLSGCSLADQRFCSCYVDRLADVVTEAQFAAFLEGSSDLPNDAAEAAAACESEFFLLAPGSVAGVTFGTSKAKTTTRVAEFIGEPSPTYSVNCGDGDSYELAVVEWPTLRLFFEAGQGLVGYVYGFVDFVSPTFDPAADLLGASVGPDIDRKMVLGITRSEIEALIVDSEFFEGLEDWAVSGSIDYAPMVYLGSGPSPNSNSFAVLEHNGSDARTLVFFSGENGEQCS